MRATYVIANELQRNDVGDLIKHDILQLKQIIYVCGGCVCVSGRLGDIQHLKGV